MEQFDKQLEARVWQRVQGNPSPVPVIGEITGLLQQELTDFSLYRQLSFPLPGHRTQLQQLTAITRQCAATLKGILFLLTDTHPEASGFPIQKELPSAALRRSYRNILLRVSQYRQHAEIPEYAPGFLFLAQLSQDRCQLLLQILGGLISQ